MCLPKQTHTNPAVREVSTLIRFTAGPQSSTRQFMGYESRPRGRSDVQEQDTLMNSQFIVLSSSACLLGNCGGRDNPADCQTCGLADDQST